MHTLYYNPAYCSLSAHISLIEAALPHRLVRVDLKKQMTEDGRAYAQINAKGYVPALELPDGEILTESAAVLQYIADTAPDCQLAPPSQSRERYRLQEWLNYLATEIHKRAGLLVNARTPDAMREIVREQLTQRLAWLDHSLVGKSGLMGGSFTVADAHLFFLLHGFKRLIKFDLAAMPELERVFATGLSRPAIRTAMDREGLQVLHETEGRDI